MSYRLRLRLRDIIRDRDQYQGAVDVLMYSVYDVLTDASETGGTVTVKPNQPLLTHEAGV